MTDIKSADIRQSFIDFFKDRNHSHQPSSPVIPLDDPTLLFINAGMNQFKDVFTGSRKVSYKRAVSSQKCIRAGGKHNDLENVGETGRHHTFFEMLGNFSFGDYFKEEAIIFAWDWVTKVLGLPKDKLYASVYEEDDEAFELWGKIAPELKNGRILRFGKKDNFWAMGDTGPCGPSSEIHIDRGERFSRDDPNAAVNTENERFVEFWNLVFMQYERTVADGDLNPLPKPSVDTGAGLERIAAIMQGADSNYETDLFFPLTSHVADITGVKYDPGPKGVSHRVIADHIRALSFALADGGGLSNEGRGYVLRRILRRAARHGRLLGYKEPIICQLVPTLIDIMGGYFTELSEKRNHIENVIKSEEERFGELLDTGLELFASLKKKVKASGSDTIPGEDIFKLYDTYGFPVDMTAIMAREAGLKMDMDGFDQHMSARQEQSRAGSNFKDSGSGIKIVLEKAGEQPPPSKFLRGEMSPIFEVRTCITFRSIGSAGNGKPLYTLALNETPFYAEAGGQVGDFGTISNDKFVFSVKYVENFKGIYLHSGEIIEGTEEDFSKASEVVAQLNKSRRWDIMRNHTATHLLHAALRSVVGDHVKQSGSLVEPDRLRFDFAHFKALTPEEIAEIEKIVNQKILEGLSVKTKIMNVDEALKVPGIMALFDEKYGDEVRVVYVGEGDDLLSGKDIYSKELCGGTHVTNTAQIGSCYVTDESAIASGIRRIEAVTGRVAAEMGQANKQAIRQVGAMLNVPAEEVIDAVKKVTATMSELQKENKKLKAERFSGGAAEAVGQKEKVGDLEFSHHDFGEIDQESASGWADGFKSLKKPAVAVAVGIINGKRTFIASASKGAVENGFDCGRLFGELVRELGGRGGGKAAFARGGLSDEVAYDTFIAAIRDRIAQSG